MEHSADELLKYKELLDQGIITQEDFEAKKAEILSGNGVKAKKKSSFFAEKKNLYIMGGIALVLIALLINSLIPRNTLKRALTYSAGTKESTFLKDFHLKRESANLFGVDAVYTIYDMRREGDLLEVVVDRQTGIIDNIKYRYMVKGFEDESEIKNSAEQLLKLVQRKHKPTSRKVVTYDDVRNSENQAVQWQTKDGINVYFESYLSKAYNEHVVEVEVYYSGEALYSSTYKKIK